MSESTAKKIIFADFIFETDSNTLLRNDNETVALEPSAARVLRFFLENGNRLISKKEILDTIWAEVFTTEDVLKRAVSQIRRALGDDAQNPRFIETHHRRGYRFIALPQNDPLNDDKEAAAAKEKVEEFETATAPNFDCFVGRKTEMEFLQTEFRRVLQGAGQPILIVGDPGIGKTQTTLRFTAWMQKHEKTHAAVALRVRFFDYEASFLPAYDVFLSLLGEACAAIFGAESKADLKQAIGENLHITLPEELFNYAANSKQTMRDASRVIVPLAESFVRLSRMRPLVLIFDDIQWADETSRKIIGYLMRVSGNAPFMLVALIRPGDLENSSSALEKWLEKQAVYRSFTTLKLAPLSQENCRAIISEIFGGMLTADKIPARDLQTLHTATGGNPYFLVETLRLLLSENAIEKESSGWRWNGLKDIPLPETIRMAARAKLTKLSNEARELVECAAVLGDTFQIETLGLMLEDYDKLLDEGLDEAIAEQVLTEQNVSGADDCQFYHTTLRRAVYMDLSPRRRKRLHLRAMRAIENSHAREPERFAAALAAHAENAGDFSASLKLNLQACQAAASRFDWLEAAEILHRAERVAANINLKTLENDTFLKLLSLQGEIYMSVGRRAEAEKILLQAAELAEKTNAPETANILLTLGRTRVLLGKYREAIPVLEKSLATAAADFFISAAALIQLASAKYALCEYEAAAEILQKIIGENDARNYNRAVALGKLGWIRALQSRYTEGKILLKEALEFHRTAGDLRERAVLAMCLNWCEYGTGDYESAIEYARQARREAQIIGEPYNESVAQMRIAKARIAQGLFDEADRLLMEAWKTQKDLDAPHAKAETIWMRGRNNLEKGDFPAAENDLRIALEMIIEVGDRDDEFRILIDQARLQLALGNLANARRLAENAARIAEEIGISEGIGEALTVQSQTLLKLKKPAEALHLAQHAAEQLEKYGSGERWRAFYSLGASLIATKSQDFEKIESALRSAVSILDKIREEFSAADKSFHFQSTKSLAAPARLLSNFLASQNQAEAAAKIDRAWLIDR